MSTQLHLDLFLKIDKPTPIIVIHLWPRESHCCGCGRFLSGCKQAIPLYEGYPVTHDDQGEWGGFDACLDCFTEYTKVQALGQEALDIWWSHLKVSSKKSE